MGEGALESGYPPEIDDIYDGAHTKVIPTGAGQSERPGGGWRLFDSLRHLRSRQVLYNFTFLQHIQRHIYLFDFLVYCCCCCIVSHLCSTSEDIVFWCSGVRGG